MKNAASHHISMHHLPMKYGGLLLVLLQEE
jgi:hypothetical protein